MDNKKCIQIKFNQYLYKYQDKSLSLPELKFLKQIAYGILRCGHIHISKIGSSLEEDITLKNTCKRLGYHLGKEDLHERLNESHIAANRYFLSRCPLYKLGRVVKDLFVFTNIRLHPNIRKHTSAQMELWI